MVNNKRRAPRLRSNDQTKRIRSSVLGILRSRTEQKYFDAFTASTASTVAGVVIPLTQHITQGDSLTQRTGNKIFLEKIDLRLNAVLPALGLVGTLRVVVVADRLNTAVNPAVLNVLQSASVTSPPNIVARSNSRFQYIYDECLPMVVGGSDQQVHIQWSKRFNKTVDYNDITDIQAANGRNALYIVILTDLAANTPFYSLDFGMHYSDL